MTEEERQARKKVVRIEWVKNNLEKYKNYMRIGAKRNRQKINIRAKNWRLENIEKSKAHNIIGYMLLKGEIARESCEICGELKTEAHHDNYNKPRIVRWLCVKHHKEFHMNHKYNKKTLNYIKK